MVNDAVGARDPLGGNARRGIERHLARGRVVAAQGVGGGIGDGGIGELTHGRHAVARGVVGAVADDGDEPVAEPAGLPAEGERVVGEAGLGGVEETPEAEVDGGGVVGVGADEGAVAVEGGEVPGHLKLIGQGVGNLAVEEVGARAEDVRRAEGVGGPAGARAADGGEIEVPHHVLIRVAAAFLVEPADGVAAEPAVEAAEVGLVRECGAELAHAAELVAVLALGLGVGHEVAGVEGAVGEVAVDVDLDQVEGVGGKRARVAGEIAGDLEVEAFGEPLFEEELRPAAVETLGGVVPGAGLEVGVAGQAGDRPRVDALVAGLVLDAAEGVGSHLRLEAHVDHRIGQGEADDPGRLLGGKLGEGEARVEGGLRAAAGGPGDAIGGKGDRGGALGLPLQHAGVEAPHQRGDVAVEAVLLVVGGDRGVAERAGGDAEGEAILLAPLVEAELALFVVQGVEAHGEASGHDRLVVVEGHAPRTPAVVLRLHLGLRRGGELRAFGGGDGDALRAAHADEQGVGSAGEREALEVVGVVRGEGGEEVVRQPLLAAVGDESADRILLARAKAQELAGGARAVAVLALDGVDARGVEQGLVEGVGREVLEEFRRDHREGGADVAQIGAQARAGECLLGGVTGILGRADLEGRELDDLAGTGGGAGGGGGGSEGDRDGGDGEQAKTDGMGVHGGRVGGERRGTADRWPKDNPT